MFWLIIIEAILLGMFGVGAARAGTYILPGAGAVDTFHLEPKSYPESWYCLGARVGDGAVEIIRASHPCFLSSRSGLPQRVLACAYRLLFAKDVLRFQMQITD